MQPTLNQAHIVAFNRDYLFRGHVITGSRRFSDILNDRLARTFKMVDLRVYALADLATPTYSAEEFYVRKRQFDVFAILKEERIAPGQRLYAYVAKERHPAVLFVRGFKVEGDVHLRPKHDSTANPVRDGEQFVPITDATLTSLHYSTLKMHSSTLILRESSLDAFSISEEALSRRVT